MANHALCQDVERHVGRASSPCTASIGRLHIDVEEVLVGEGVQAQHIELALEVGDVGAHRGSCHAPPVQEGQCGSVTCASPAANSFSLVCIQTYADGGLAYQPGMDSFQALASDESV